MRSSQPRLSFASPWSDYLCPMPNTYPFQLHTTLRLVFHALRPYSFLLGKESGSLCNLPCHPICLPGREHKAQYHSPQPLLTRPANRLSYWRERDKEPLDVSWACQPCQAPWGAQGCDKAQSAAAHCPLQRKVTAGLPPCGQRTPVWVL